jgi:assimilatory nitrate reductase catalytic subunit
LVSGKVDELSGQPELKATAATIEAVTVHFHGVLLRRTEGPLPAICHWVRGPVENGQMYRLAGLQPMPPGDLARSCVPAAGEWLEVSDKRRGVLRVAVLRHGVLEACLFVARDARFLPRELPTLGMPVPDPARPRLLAGQALGETAGAKICACFGVPRDTIERAVITHRLCNVREIGERLRAGTNCGSCIPELEEILRDARIPAA